MTWCCCRGTAQSQDRDNALSTTLSLYSCSAEFFRDDLASSISCSAISSTSRVAINSHWLCESFIVVVEARYRYTQWQCVSSVIFSSQCDFLHQWCCTIMEEWLSQENYLRLALRLRCGFCQITLTSCLTFCIYFLNVHYYKTLVEMYLKVVF